MNRYLINFVEKESSTRFDELKENLNKLAENSTIESDSNVISKYLDINHIHFSPRIYCDTTNSNLAIIK